MLEVSVSGTPFARGQAHGTAAAKLVAGSLEFYNKFFSETAKLPWDQVTAEAEKWLPLLEKEYPQYVEEIRGLADGAGVPFASILALNVRTEVAFGLYSDGCTALAVHSATSTPPTAILAQNWDWKHAQSDNLIRLRITSDKGVISIITEAGIIGKIGLSSAGVGVCLNAITALGVSHSRLPVHLTLRAALDWSLELAAAGEENIASTIAERIKTQGVASAGHILLADKHTAFGLEASYKDVVEVRKTHARGVEAVLHSNHYVEDHPGVRIANNGMFCSPHRLERIEELLKSSEGHVAPEEVWGWLKDEERYPSSICRDRSSKGGSETLFTIVMELEGATAKVKVGKPNGNGEEFVLKTR